jgi:hypothetical protein
MHRVATVTPATTGNKLLGQVDAMRVHGDRLSVFEKLVGGDPKKGVALLQAASLSITVPVADAVKYPGKTLVVTKDVLIDLVDPASKTPIKPLAIDGVIAAMVVRYPGYSALAR